MQELNEDEVPMNEYDIQKKWKAYIEASGLYASRIENIGVSLPDMFFIYKGMTIWHEMKIQRGHLIYMPHFQWSNSIRMQHSLHPWQLNIVVYNKGTFSGYTIAEIKKQEPQAASEGKLKVSLLGAIPLFQVDSQLSFEKYIEFIHSKMFKPKSV
jgi:hypothetical protein